MRDEEVKEIKLKHLNTLICTISKEEIEPARIGEYPVGSYLSCRVDGFKEGDISAKSYDLGTKIIFIENKIPVDVMGWGGWEGLEPQIWIKTQPFKKIKIKKEEISHPKGFKLIIEGE